MDFESISDLVDLARYPVNQLDSAEGKNLVARIKADLERDGASSLPGFLRPEAVEAIAAQARALVPLAYAGPAQISPYFFNYDLAGRDVPDDHPTRFKGRRDLAQVAYDLIPKDSLLCRLYHSDLVTRLVAAVQGKPKYRLADRYQSLNIAVMNQGGCQQWHFDRGALVTTMLVQAPESGGVFEYVPNIRSEEDEHFDAVAKVLDGDRSRVRQNQHRTWHAELIRGALLHAPRH